MIQNRQTSPSGQTNIEVMFVMNDVPEPDFFVANARAGVDVVLLDAQADGLEQMAHWAAGRHGYQAAHIVSHGVPGQLNLGKLSLGTDTLAHRLNDVATVRAALADNGEVLVYGCHVARDHGNRFVQSFSDALGLPVAASTDATGNAQQGGTWLLETTTGSIVTPLAIDQAARQQYAHVLAPFPSKTFEFTAGVDGNDGGSNFSTTWTTLDNPTYTLNFSITGAAAGEVYGSAGFSGDSYAIGNSTAPSTITAVISMPGYKFDLTSLALAQQESGSAPSYQITTAASGNQAGSLTAGGAVYQTITPTGPGFTSLSSFTLSYTAAPMSPQSVFTLDTLMLANIVPVGPLPTDAKISISGGTGAGGAYVVGDVVTMTWDNTAATGDNQAGVTGVKADFSQFGGTVLVNASNSLGIWTASYGIGHGTIDVTNANVSITATNGSQSETVADTTNAVVDNVVPTVSASRISLTGATGIGGVFKIGDTVTASWDNSASGDNNPDIISARLDFNAFGNNTAPFATNSNGVWTATTTIVAGSANGTNKNVSFFVSDNANNRVTSYSISNVTVDSIAPTVTDAHVSLGGSSYKIGDTITATWDNTAGGDNNSEAISSVAFNFSAFGGGTAVAATNNSGVWTASYTVTGSSFSGSNLNVSASVTDGSGNTTTRLDTTNASIDAAAPTITSVTASTAAGSYKAGDVVTIKVNFSEVVTVTSGAPLLSLNTGGTASYGYGSGTSQLTFSYTIAAGHNAAALDFANTSALSLSGATIRDAIGNNADLTLPTPGAAGSLANSVAIVVDTLAPTIKGDDIIFNHDTGSNTTDLVTSMSTQDITYHLDGTLAFGNIVEMSVNNGGAWFDATSAEGIVLTGTDTIKVRVKDAAGNIGAEFGRVFVIDTTAPTPNAAGATPVDNAVGVATSGTIVLPFSEPLDATASVLTSVKLRDILGHQNVAATVSINGSGQLVIVPLAALAPSTAYSVVWDASALKDRVGLSAVAVADDTTYNFTTLAAPPSGGSGGGGTPPPAGQTTVDGATVQTGSTTNSNGTVTNTVAVTPISATRPDDSSSSNTTLADIPLASLNGNTVLQIGLPVGAGVIASETTGSNLSLRDKLLSAGLAAPQPSDVAQSLTSAIDAFVATALDPSQVTVRTLTLTTDANFNASAAGSSITIKGTSGLGEGDTAHPQRQEALVLDARQLPSGSTLVLDDVEFAVVVGAVRVIGGNGKNTVVGDGSAQVMLLGAGDDVVRGGAGNDVVGGQNGDDKLYGDEGNDAVVGGMGNDVLEGGTGNDVLMGGSSDAGTWTFGLGANGTMRVGFNASQPTLGELPSATIEGNFQGGAVIDPRLAFINNDYVRVETTSLVFQGLIGQLPTLQMLNSLATPEWTKEALLQAAWGWYESTLPAGASTAEKATALIGQTLGAPLATPSNVQIAVDFLGQGGTWTQALDFLVHQPQVKDTITTQTANGPVLTLAQTATFAETGWSANSGNDILLGGAGNDVLVGGGGSDAIDGGDGIDMAVYFGGLDQYAFTLQTNTSGTQEVLIRHLASGDVDTLRNVELLQVGGQNYRVPTEGTSGVEYPLLGHATPVSQEDIVLVGLPAF